MHTTSTIYRHKYRNNKKLSFGYLDAEISGTNDVLNFSGDEHRLELCGQIGCPVRNVEIAQSQH